MRRIVLALMLLSRCHSAFALNPALEVNQYAHTAWRVRDGFTKGATLSMAQTADGYLSEFGLFRFDGVRTVPWTFPAGQHLPSEYITKLLRARDDTLWIGTRAGLSAWKYGRLIEYPQFSGKSIVRLFEDRKGVLWIATVLPSGAGEDLCALRNGAFTCEATGRGIGTVHTLYEDRRGDLWVGTAKGLWHWSSAPDFIAIPEGPVYGLNEEEDGALLLGTTRGVRRFVDGHVEGYPLNGVREMEVHELFRDRDGGLWIATATAGLLHAHGGKADVFAVLNGFSGATPTAFFEDAEHNVWVSTTAGLDRFREFAVTRLSVIQGLPLNGAWSVLALRNEDIWVGTPGGLRQWSSGRLTAPEMLSGQRDGKLNGESPTSLLEDSRGRIWIITVRHAGYVENHRFVAVGKLIARNPVRAMIEDVRGNVWIADQERGLFRVPRDGSAEQTAWSTFGDRGEARAVAADLKRGGVWLGFRDGSIAHFADGRVAESYGDGATDHRGVVRQLWFDGAGTLWASTDGGLGRLKNGRIAMLNSRNGLPCDFVHSAIEDNAHAFWVSMSCGFVRIARADLDAWAASVDENRNPPRMIQPMVLDPSDGALATSTPVNFVPRAAKGVGGELWFAGSDGVRVIDPAHLPLNAVAPPVRIEQVIADRTRYEPPLASDKRMRLPLLRDLQIDYTALSFAAPEKVQFRYKLEGFDRDWQNGGNRRQAVYTDLPQRRYRFRVMAANNSGVWNETGAFLDFSIAPEFYQTTWFAALSIVTLAAAIWGAHRVRLRGVEKHRQEISALNEQLMKAQEQERIRIAGELHDGVMQEMLAVTMMVGTVRRRIPAESDVKATLDKIEAKVVRVGTDLRRLSHDLHPPLLQEAGLPGAVRAYCEEFSAASAIPVSCEVDDNARDLSRGRALALFRVMQEALGNAAKHAKATRISVRLARTDDTVSLIVSDDGAGFDRSGPGSGGLGLIMMRERASQLDGEFDFESAPGRGTTTRAAIPFR